MEELRRFVYCEKCGKKLIERLPNGMFRFMFGKNKDSGRTPVDMFIYGSVKMKCIKGTCQHWNIFNFFPPQFKNVQSEQEILRYDVNDKGKEV